MSRCGCLRCSIGGVRLRRASSEGPTCLDRQQIHVAKRLRTTCGKARDSRRSPVRAGSGACLYTRDFNPKRKRRAVNTRGLVGTCILAASRSN